MNRHLQSMENQIPISCEKADVLLAVKESETLSLLERSVLAEHLANCPDCKDRAGEWDVLHTVLRSAIGTPANVDPAKLAQWTRATQAATRPVFRRQWWWAVAALVPILGLLIFVHSNETQRPVYPLRPETAPVAVVVTEVAAPRSVVWTSTACVRIAPPGGWVRRTVVVGGKAGLRGRITVTRRTGSHPGEPDKEKKRRGV